MTILAPMIKGIVPGLPEIGKIKIGKKGAMKTSQRGKKFQMPERLDHFSVTTLERGPDGNFIRDDEVHKVVGEKPVEIPITMLYNDPELNFQSRWACFTGTTLWCTGDGETAIRKQQDGTSIERQCPCERSAPDFNADKYRCKTSGVLSVVLDSMQSVGGVYKFRTTSYNSVVNIMSSMALIQRITGGVLAGIPLMLTVRPKTVITPVTNKAMKVWTVGIIYKGTVAALADAGYKIALEGAHNSKRIEQIEDTAKKLVLLSSPESLTENETERDIADEFYPEAVNEAAGVSGANDLQTKLDAADNGKYGDMMTAEDRDMGTTTTEQEKPYETMEELLTEDPPIELEPQNEFHTVFKKLDPELLDEFVKASSERLNMTIEEIREAALTQVGNFVSGFCKWEAEQDRTIVKTGSEDLGDLTGTEFGKKLAEHEANRGPDNEPTIESLKWNPLMESVKKRYGAKKNRLIQIMLEERGVEFQPTWPGSQLHSLLLSTEASSNAAKNAAQSPHDPVRLPNDPGPELTFAPPDAPEQATELPEDPDFSNPNKPVPQTERTGPPSKWQKESAGAVADKWETKTGQFSVVPGNKSDEFLKNESAARDLQARTGELIKMSRTLQDIYQECGLANKIPNEDVSPRYVNTHILKHRYPAQSASGLEKFGSELPLTDEGWDRLNDIIIGLVDDGMKV